jgi:Regulator of chromosome condensation (RCC1) repeat
VTAITAGTEHNCALTKAGAVECWGRNSFGQLGDGTATNRRRPVEVAGLGAAIATIAIVARSVPVNMGRVAAITLRCGSASGCTGSLTLTSRGRRLGGSPFSIGQASTQAVGVKLTRPAFSLLVRAKRVAAVARIDYAQPGGGTTKASGTVTLLAPKTR